MSNRADKYEQLHKALKKHFKPQPEPGERSVLEHLIYACCLEDAKTEQADEAFAKLQQAYFDWNEVRVTTVIELGEALNSLPNAVQAGHRIKRCLQSLFEARYQYDIDDLKKANLSKATEEMSAWKGISPFILNYVSQSALGGHAIPAGTLTFEVLVQCELLTQIEAEKKTLPGAERAIPKNKGFEFGTLLHQFAVEFQQNPKNAAVVAVFKDLGVTPKAKVATKSAIKKDLQPSEVAIVIPATPAPGKSKSKVNEVSGDVGKNTRKPDSGTVKKLENEVIASGKAKQPPAKSEASKPSKPETKKKVETKTSEEKKTDAKKSDAKKLTVKPSAKKPVEKLPMKKVEEKPTAKKTDKKKIAETKKPEPASKQKPPPKKVETSSPPKRKPR